MNWIKCKDKQPTKYGKYLVFRDGCGKWHSEVWNGTGWAYNHDDITEWYDVESELPSSKTVDNSRVAYDKGFQDALSAYAYMKDGVYYVGTCGTTLKEALEKRENSYIYNPPK